MEKSIKRVEKLVHATSSALAQMKFSLMFDDVNGGKSGPAGKAVQDFDATVLEKFLQEDELNYRQNEFKLEANETLAKIDKMASDELNRKNQKPLERIKEINQKMNQLKLEQSKRGETKQSRQKLLSLINEEKFSPGLTPGKESIGSRQTAREPPDKLPSRKTETKSPTKSKTELKNRILETQEIVDRGFQTARQLAQKVESMTKLERKDRTPSTGKTVSDVNTRSLDGKTESNESVKIIKCKRHSHRQRKEENTRVVDIRRSEKETRRNLQLQQLPSLHIRGGLKIQKIHSLEIPACEEVQTEKTNTGVSFLSHEQMQREKMERTLEKVRKENCVCHEKDTRTNYVECFNCGKLIKVRGSWVSPHTIDEVLRRCDFNVFDPRIDEFVEKYAEGVSQVPVQSVATEVKLPPKEVVKEEPKKSKRFTLRDLSDELCKKYKEEADALADNHLKVDEILRNIFKKVEESKEVFETCHLLRSYKELEKPPKLTTTKPVLVTLPGVRNKQKKLDKKDVKNRSKSRTEILEEVPQPKEKIVSFTHSPVVPEKEVTSSSTSPEKPDLKERKIKKTLMMASVQKKRHPVASKPKDSSTSSSSGRETKQEDNTSPERKEEDKPRPCQTSPEKSENNYESDFESDPEEEAEEPEASPVVKKLSTISEVDSELEKKVSDDQKTSRLEVEQKDGGDSVASAKSRKSTPTELVTSLRDILSALKDQFARTESLAEKLTESSKVERKEVVTPDGMLNPWKIPDAEKLVENLQSSRKDRSKLLCETPAGVSKTPEDVSEEGGSSLGEIIVSEGRRTSNTSSISEESILNLMSEDRSLVSCRREIINTPSVNLVS